MKMEWSTLDVAPVGSLGRANRAIFGVVLAGPVFSQFRTSLWSLSHFVMLEAPLEL